MLADGQNLNFAVPVSYVRSLLEQKAVVSPALNAAQGLEQAKDLLDKRSQAQYSADPSSPYQQATVQALAILESVVSSATKEDVLTGVACLGTQSIDVSEVGIRAARKLFRQSPSVGNRALLSYVLLDHAEDESIESQIAEQGSDAQASANKSHDQFLLEAGQVAAEAARTAKGDQLLIANYVLGSAESEAGKYSEAVSFHSSVAQGTTKVCGDDLTVKALRDLISESENAKRHDDAEKWFRRYASLYEPSSYEWDAEGDRRNAARDPSRAAESYEKAATGSDYYSYDFCFAAVERYAEPLTDSDGVLLDGRKCIDASVSQSQKQTEHFFKTEVPFVYGDMAEVLEARGVYQSALEYAKESLAISPDNPFVLSDEAKIFADLDRNSECIAAARAAIRISDGKYPEMQFRLGYCLFATQDWGQAEASFRIAAEADKTDAVSAFNLGLCLSRQGFDSDANNWFREALTRNPDAELRAKIMAALK